MWFYDIHAAHGSCPLDVLSLTTAENAFLISSKQIVFLELE
jgi:hypothetical protein